MQEFFGEHVRRGRRSLRLATVVGVVGVGLLVSACGNLLDVGSGVACVVRADGIPTCFGTNGSSQAGQSASAEAAPAPVVLPRGAGAGDISVGMGNPNGQATTCAVVGRTLPQSQVRCWGDDSSGQLGRGTAGTSSATPVRVPVKGGVSSVGVGAAFACVIASAQGVTCWGENAVGQLGDRATGVLGPALVPGASWGSDTSPDLLAVGAAHACAGTNETISCWGAGTTGQLGNGGSTNSAAPQRASLPKGLSIVALSAGGDTTCAIGRREGSPQEAWCWGSTVASAVPKRVDLGTWEPLGISIGLAHICVLSDGGTVWCWGANASGQLGTGTTTPSSVPVQVRGVKATIVAAGADSTCASTRAGKLRCWGANASGQLGVAPAALGSSLTPATVPGINDLRSPIAKKVVVRGGAQVGATLKVQTPAWPYAASYGYTWQRRGADGVWEDLPRRAASLRLTRGLAGATVRATVSGANVWTETGRAMGTMRSSAPIVVRG